MLVFQGSEVCDTIPLPHFWGVQRPSDPRTPLPLRHNPAGRTIKLREEEWREKGTLFNTNCSAKLKRKIQNVYGCKLVFL
jgi:hypothetical protein